MASPLLEKSREGLRAWLRKVWDVRGGGLYACGFAITFIVLEAGSLADDVLGSGAVFRGEVVAFLVDFMIDSLMNTFYALIWPVFVVQWAPPWGALALGAAYWLFPLYVKQHIEAWLFDGEPDQPEDSEASDGA